MALSPEAAAFAAAYDLAQNNLNPPTLVQAPEVPPDPSAQPIERSHVAVPGLSAASAQAAGNALIAGGMKLEDVRAALAAEGFPNFGIETRTPAQIQNDLIAYTLAPEGKPEHYNGIDYHSNGRSAGQDPEQLAKFDASAREWAAALKLPPAVASSVIEKAIDHARQSDRLSPAQLEARDLEAQSKLAYFAGRRGVTVDKMVEAARAVLATGGKFSGRLDASGVLGSWPIVVEIYDHSVNMATAHELRKKS